MKIRSLMFLPGLLAIMLAAPVRNAPAQETPAQLVDRAHNAHGGRWRSGEIADWVADGKITLFTISGPARTFDVTLSAKGRTKIHLVVKQRDGEVHQGFDGVQSWQAMGGVSAVAHGAGKDFLESQTVRSTETLFNYDRESLVLRDLGSRTSGLGVPTGRTARVIEADNRRGHKTRYLIDQVSSLVGAMEFDLGQQPTLGGSLTTATEVCVFSDFRDVQGAKIPFKIERYRSGVKYDQIQLTSVRHNVGVRDDRFRR